MPDAPQGILRFDGIDFPISFVYTLSHGIQPGIFSVQMAPQEGDIPIDPQTVTIEFGEDVSLEFDFCVADQATIRRDDKGMIVSVAIKDRRWAWQYGEISGRYNLRNKDGSIYQPTEKNPQELATLLLDAMNEEDFDVSALDTRPRPQRNWDFANPARELEQLAEELGCRVVLTTEGNVLIALKGTGSDLPDNGLQRTVDFGVNPPDRPDSLKIVAGPTRFETQFILEAVGEDIDGTIKPVAELSYEPESGWAEEIPGVFYNVQGLAKNNAGDNDNKSLAQKWVWKAYRIKCTPDGNFHIPGYDGSSGEVNDLWQLLPLEDARVTVFFDEAGVEHPCPAIVSGQWYEESADEMPISDAFGGRVWPHGFQIDRERAIVILSQPAALLDENDGTWSEANLYLTIAHGVKSPDDFTPNRYTNELEMPGEPTGAGVMILRRDDIQKVFVGNYDSDHNLLRVDDINDEIETEAQYYFEAALIEFQTKFTGHVEYAGIIDISPDGAIQQVEWRGGKGGATTQASINTEFSLIVPPYKERRAKQHLIGLLNRTPFGDVRTPNLPNFTPPWSIL